MSNLAPIKVIACIVQYICLTLNTPALDIVCIWVSTPLKNTTPSFLPSSPLNLQTAQAPPFKISQFELLVMTEQNILVYKLFFVIFLTDNQVKFLMFITFIEMSKEPWCLPTKKICIVDPLKWPVNQFPKSLVAKDWLVFLVHETVISFIYKWF